MNGGFMKNIFCTVVLFAILTGVFAQEVRTAPQDTLVEGSDKNLRDYILEQISKGEKNISIPKGKYWLDALNSQHIVLKKLDSVSIDFNGSELICKSNTRAITVLNCNNLTLKNLSIDYDPLPYTQGVIKAISEDKLTHTIELMDGYPDVTKATEQKYEVYDSKTKELKCSTYFSCKIGEVFENENKLTIVKPKHYLNSLNQNEEVGDFVVMATKDRKYPHAIVIDSSSSTTLENVVLYSSNSFSFYEANSNESVYENCGLMRKPEALDYVKRFPRLRSGNADGFHSKFAIKGPSYLNCFSAYNGDDSVAINGAYNVVHSANGAKLKVLATSADLRMQEGDEVEILLRSGNLELGKIKSITRLGKTSAEDLSDLAAAKTWEHIMASGAFKESYEVELEKALHIEPLSMIISKNRIGAGFKIIGGSFGHNRSRGLIIKSSDGIIKGVKLEASWMMAINMGPEWFWAEGAHSHNVLIEDNEIFAGADKAIYIHSNAAKGNVYSQAGAHKNITIKNNKIHYYYKPAIFISSLDGLTMQNNKLIEMASPLYNLSSKSLKPSDEIVLINVIERPAKK